jgi:tetratricopeptide (TPR) repeat protein
MAGAMAQSACYLVFFTPTTFRTSFTRRELEAMRILQQRRGQFLGVGRLGLGLILPMVLRRDDQMPEFLKRIQWFDFEGAMSGGPNWFRSRRARQQIREVAEAVYARCREADAIPQAFADWQSFVLPPEIDLRADASPGFSSATVPISEDPADLLRQGSEHLNHGEYEEARRKMERAIAIYESRSDMRGLTLALNDLGESYYITRDFPEAEQHYQRALAITGDTGDLIHTAIILDNLGLVQAEQGQSDEAKASYRKSLDLFEGLDDKAGMAAVLGNLGWVLLNRNDFFEAIDSFNQQLTLARETGSVQREGIALSNLGHAYARSGELTRAVEFHRQAIQVFESIGDRGNLADALYSLTQTLYAFGQPAQAIPHGERAAEIYDQLGATRRAGEVRQLLANLRRQQGGDGDASIRKLAQEYDDVHRGMTGSSARTRRVNEIVEQMRDWVPSVRSLIDVYSRSSSPGLRVAGVVILQEAPDQNYLGWLSERVKRETPFVGHQAALALLNAVRRLDDEYYDRLGEAIANAKASLDAKNLSRDADRYVTLEQADRELQTRRTTSAYYDPESIKEIGRRLQTGTYPELTEQLKEGEIIVGLFRAPNQVLLATHITNEARLTQMESRNAPEGFFALRFVQGSEGESPYVLAERPRAPRPARKKKAARAAPRKAAKPKKKAAAKRPTRKK